MEDASDKESAARGEDDRDVLTLRLIVGFGDDLKIFELRQPNISAEHYRRVVMRGSECITRELQAMVSLVGQGSP
jgi:hypothetical protein